MFIDTAVALIDAAVPPPDAPTRAEALARALASAASVGLTGVHDMGTSLADLALYRRFADAGKLTVRISAYADGDGDALAALCAMGPYYHASGRLRMSGVKLYADGALGSRGAALLADYHDEPGQRGLLVTEPAALEAAMVKARDCGVQVATHAIGDRANRMVLDAYARVHGTGRGGAALAHRACADRLARRHTAIREAARNRVDAADPCDVGRALGRVARRQGGPARRLRLAAFHRQRREARLWLGLPRRVRRSASRPLRRDHA